MLIGSFTSLLAATIGMCQKDIKKIIAYSTCSQLGYMVFTCGISKYDVAFFHLFNHAFFKALLFMGAGIIIHYLNEEQDIRRMGNLLYYLPITYSLFFISTLSLLGFPFLSGYYSKDFLIESSFITYNLFNYYSFVLGNIVAGITSFYSFKILYNVFYKNNYNFYKIHLFSLKSIDLDIYIFFSIILLFMGSIFFGFVFKELFIGESNFFFYNSLIFVNLNFYYYELFFINVIIK